MINARLQVIGRPHRDQTHLGLAYEREEIAMHSTPDAVLMLHNVRQSELANEATRVKAARQACTPCSPPRGIAATLDPLRVAIARAGEFVRTGGAQRMSSSFRAEAG
jgi:hypothetical protein